MRRDRVRIRTGLLREFGLEGPLATSAARPWSPSSMKCRARLNFVRTLLPPGRLFAAGADDQVDRDARDHALRLGASGRGEVRAPFTRDDAGRRSDGGA